MTNQATIFQLFRSTKLFIAAGLVAASSMTLAYGGHHEGGHHKAGYKMAHKMVEKLDLSDEQEDQLDALRDKYKPEFKQARKAKDKEQMQATAKAMQQEIQSILTAEQKQELIELKQKKVDKYSAKKEKRLVNKLDLNDQQQGELHKLIEQQTSAKKAQIAQAGALDFSAMKQQRQENKQALDTLFSQILDQEQQQEWQELSAKMEKRYSRKHGSKYSEYHDCDDD